MLFKAESDDKDNSGLQILTEEPLRSQSDPDILLTLKLVSSCRLTLTTSSSRAA